MQDVVILGLDGVSLLSGELVVLLDVGGLPGVADPLIADGARSMVAALGDHVVGQNTLLGLVLVLQSYKS